MCHVSPQGKDQEAEFDVKCYEVSVADSRWFCCSYRAFCQGSTSQYLAGFP